MLLYKRRPNRVYYLMKNKEKLRKFVTYCFINKSYEDIGILNEPNCSDIYAPGRDYPTPYLYFFPIVLHRFLAQKSKCGSNTSWKIIWVLEGCFIDCGAVLVSKMDLESSKKRYKKRNHTFCKMAFSPTREHDLQGSEAPWEAPKILK